jgi:hypothetical protein
MDPPHHRALDRRAEAAQRSLNPPDDRQRPLLLLAILAGAALMHGVPQASDYLVTRWMTFGLGGAIFLSLMLLEDWDRPRLDSLARLHWLLLVVYLVHQFEEHGVDLLGRSNFFIAYARNVIGSLGAASGFELTAVAIYRTNTLFVWLAFLVAVWGHQRFLWPGLAAAGLVLTNAILHLGIALWQEEYNPGLASAVVLFLPIALLYFGFVRRHCAVRWRGIAGGVLFGVAAHVLLLLRIRFNLAPAMPPAALGAIALAPLVANAIYNRLRQA